MPDPITIIIVAAVAVIVLAILYIASAYVKAPPNKAYIISGIRSKKRVLIGKAGFRWPFFERLDKLSLDVMQVDVKTSEAVPTNEFINVSVDGVANIKISSDPELINKAAEALLSMDQRQLIFLCTQVLEGNMREIVGSVGLKEMVQERQIVAEKIKENAVPDMRKLGIEIVNFNIQNFKDAAGTIENMGIDNVEQIRKAAQIAKAEAARDISIAEAEAREVANKVTVDTNLRISEQNNALSIRQSELKKDADIKKAEADAAYEIQREQQRKTIEVTAADADIARREKDAELAEKEIALQERRLDAEIRKKADALKYEAEKKAEAELIKRQKEAEARRFEEEQAALARMRMAEAEKFEQEQQAIAQRALADALAYSKQKEAEGIRAVGLAEAEAIEKKAEAQKKMGEASVLDMYLTALPEVVKSAAAPLAQTEKIVMYGEGNSAKVVKDVMTTASQITESLEESTGIDLKSMLAGFVGGKAAAGSDD
ncbi:MAG: flotillin family protein [Clostridia bacterium]|nr:flotillin family protein [Clostridia bacterium]